MLNIKDNSIFRQKCFIDGGWQDADSGETIAIRNPATGEMLGTVPKTRPRTTRSARCRCWNSVTNRRTIRCW